MYVDYATRIAKVNDADFQLKSSSGMALTSSSSSSGMALTSSSTWLDIVICRRECAVYALSFHSLLISSRSFCNFTLVSGWPLADHTRITASYVILFGLHSLRPEAASFFMHSKWAEACSAPN